MALLRDTRQELLRERENKEEKAMIRQLEEQLTDAEALKLSALKSRHSLENEISELKIQVLIYSVLICISELQIYA